MASLGKVAAGVAAACDKASECKDALGAAGDLAEDAHAILGYTLMGDTTGDKDAVLAHLQQVVDGVRDLWKTLAKGMDHAQAVLDAVVGTAAPTPAAPPASSRTAQPPTAPTTPPVAEPPPTLPPERVEELRRDLPSTVVASTGQKTHGRWVAPDGAVQPIQSGEGPDATAVGQFLQTIPLPQPGIPMAASHVETKLAMHMRNTGIRHASVAINNRPCAGRFGCEILVGIILPEGSTLTIYGSDGYERTIQGGLRPPWQR